MGSSFASAMGRALEATRAGNASDATQIIQSTLAARQPSAAPGSVNSTVMPRRARQPLGMTIDSLINGKTVNRARKKGGAPAVPAVEDGATYMRRRHASGHGNIDYTIFVPSARVAPVRGLIVMLHGCTQSADDFATGTQMNLHAERENFIVVYPEQNRSANQLGCWNWFQPQDQQRGQGEPAMLADLARTLADEFAVPAGCTFAAGLSAGGAMAAILGSTYGDIFAGVGVHSGLAPGAANDVMSAYSAMNGQGSQIMASGPPVRTIIVHGTADATVHPDNAARVLESAIGGAATVIEARGDAAGVALRLDGSGRVLAESWTVQGLGHAWSGGSPEGSYTAPGAMDASAGMMRFFGSVIEETANP